MIKVFCCVCVQTNSHFLGFKHYPVLRSYTCSLTSPLGSRFFREIPSP